MLAKTAALEADVLIFDLEDSVPASERSGARPLISQALARPRGRALRYVRLNADRSGRFDEDLAAFVGPALDGLVLPKVDDPAQVRQLDEALARREAVAGVTPGSIRILAMIESARGLLAAPAIAASSPRLSGLMFGAEDFWLDFPNADFRGATCDEMLYTRSAIAVAAASCALAAVDRVVPDFRDADLLARDARRAYSLGYTGKALIHPDQIAAVNAAFSPTAADIAEARRVVATYDHAAAAGAGSASLDGRMIDRPVYEKARRVVALADMLPGAGS